jgi:hypothetical protein
MSGFIEACKIGDIQTVKDYLSNKKFVGLNEKDNNGRTPFYRVCYYGRTEIVELLIKTDGFNSLNEKDKYGNTPLITACSNGHKKIVELLIKADGFDSLNEKDNYGCTPFFWACYNGRQKLVKLLIKTDGFDSLNEKNNYGSTPFNRACLNGHKEIVELLLTCPNIIIPNNIKTKNAEIMELVERFKKDPEMTRLNLILKGNINLYRHIVFLCDNYYKLNEKTTNHSGLRFMKITSKLPLELQMVMIHRLCNSPKIIITSKQFDDNIVNYVEVFL